MTTDALSYYCREWSDIPQMPSNELWDRAMNNLHQRAVAKYGYKVANDAWIQFQENKNWRPHPIKHPAWEKYHAARIAWEKAISEGTKHHQRMEDAADELEAAGEMIRDHR